MAALASSAITVTRVRKMAVGNKFESQFTVTVTGNASGTWAVSGIAMPSGWKSKIGLPNKVETVMQLTPLVIAGASPDIAYTGSIDLTNDKLFLIGGADTAAEEKPLESLTTNHTPAAAAYTGTFIARGY